MLIEAFKSTLEEASQSELLLHVLDASDPELEAHIEACERVLEEIGAAEIPRIMVFNKADRASKLPLYKDSVCISALTGEGLELLKTEMLKRLNACMDCVTLDVPLFARRRAFTYSFLAKDSSINYLPEYARVEFTSSRESARNYLRRIE